MGTLPEAADNSSLRFEIQRENHIVMASQRTTYFKQNQSLG
jgi:hypothetical protein